MYDPNDSRFNDELSPLAQLPRATGDEVDDERLIANLRAAIARDTGAFALPWFRRPVIQGAALACLLLVVSVVSLRVGQQMGNFDTQMAGQNQEIIAVFQRLDRAYADSDNKESYLEALDQTIDGVHQLHREAEAGSLMGDPLYPAVAISGGPTPETQI